MKALVTGCSGYLGGKIAAHLRRAGWEVAEVLGRKDFAVQVDSEFSKARIDLVVHAGFEVDFAPGALSKTSLNIANTKYLLQKSEANGAGHFIFLGAAGVLGVANDGTRTRSEADFAETQALFESWLEARYLVEKIECERLLADAACPVTSLLLTTTYGANMQPHVLSSLRKFRNSRIANLTPPGGTSYLHLDDLLAALDIVLEKKITGRFVISSGNLSYRGLVLSASSGKTLVVTIPKIVIKPLLWAYRMSKGRFPSPVLISSFGYKYYSPGLFMRISGWRPRKNFADCLQSALED